jgi:hypothetical protein
VAKWKHGRYESDGIRTSWIKIKNSDYSQWTGRRELFEKRKDLRQAKKRRSAVPGVEVDPTTDFKGVDFDSARASTSQQS